MKIRQRYAMLSVDAEALPRRAECDHIKRLVLGLHGNKRAGIQEICAIGDEFNAKHVFFVDMCSAFENLGEMSEIVLWLDRNGQDVQLHTHPEVLPDSFWVEYELDTQPKLMNEYSDDSRAEFVVKYFGQLISQITHKDILAHRSGSFRWNACTIRALKLANIPLSFNNSMRAYRSGRCVYSEPVIFPYVWSNGVIEVPLTEKRILRPGGEDLWASLTFPESNYFQFQPQRYSFLSTLFGRRAAFSVFLLHSWSMLYWDDNGHATYLDDRRLEEYRRLLARITKDYDVITTRDFLDLHARGKIVPTHTVDVEKAEFR
jgi:hypothetical protein